MGSPPSRLALLAALVVATLLAGAAATEEDYVTLLYGDEFVLGVRVLGKSIRDRGTKGGARSVVLGSDPVAAMAEQFADSAADGWIVKRITLLDNPNQVRPTRFWGVYTKLKIFNMTSYKKVVYLDADTIVVQSIEDVFKCGKFCGNLKHSERMNSGVMVVEPCETVFKDMISKVDRLPSYTGDSSFDIQVGSAPRIFNSGMGSFGMDWNQKSSVLWGWGHFPELEHCHHRWLQ